MLTSLKITEVIVNATKLGHLACNVCQWIPELLWITSRNIMEQNKQIKPIWKLLLKIQSSILDIIPIKEKVLMDELTLCYWVLVG